MRVYYMSIFWMIKGPTRSLLQNLEKMELKFWNCNSNTYIEAYLSNSQNKRM